MIKKLEQDDSRNKEGEGKIRDAEKEVNMEKTNEYVRNRNGGDVYYYFFQPLRILHFGKLPLGN